MSPVRRRLLSAARRLLASNADAEDAVQDTYVRALTAFPGSPAPEPAWLYTVLRNVAIDRLRRIRFESEHPAAKSSGISSEALLETRSECEAALRHLLGLVSPVEAAAILLRDVFEFGYDEIGRMIGKREIAARQFVHRARIRTRRGVPCSDVDEPCLAACWRAIESRDPVLLMHLLQSTTARAQPTAAMVGEHRDAPSSSVLVQVNGRYAIALVLDGVVLCVVPVGIAAASADEPA